MNNKAKPHPIDKNVLSEALLENRVRESAQKFRNRGQGYLRMNRRVKEDV